MIKILASIFFALFPALVLADNGALSFAPPATDYSVIFLGNLFGVVDGVLHGNGSQIMGAMFGVFNAAVLALGGIIIMYTLMVSTMNTAHEGQMLGQKWSSIWIPVRSTIGLALLIPKASGYCMMQIFVMWVVVQGVGAADKVWEAALSYLNRGGVIIQGQQNPATALLGGNTEVAQGATMILAGEVCMLGIQKQLEAQRQSYLDMKQNNSGPCAGTPSSVMSTFCSTAVPDFLGSVNFVTKQSQNSTATSFALNMPNFDSAPYSALNGICGTIQWNTISDLSDVYTPAKSGGGGNSTVAGINNITSSELNTAQMSRAIALQQMYLDLGMVAQVMVNNDPSIVPASSQNTGGQTNYSLAATQQFGVPYTSSGGECLKYDDKCVTWGAAQGGTDSSGGVLFNGTEFQGAMSDYNAIMFPTLNLILQSKMATTANSARQFITQAQAQGWMMAGSYFYSLVSINANPINMGVSNLTDSGTGLNSSSFDATTVTKAFGTDGSCTGTYAILCEWLGQNKIKASQVEALIDGTILTSDQGVPVAQSPVGFPDLSASSSRALVRNLKSSTVYGFVNNSLMVQLPGQPGLAPLRFANAINFSVDTTLYTLSTQSFDCGKVKILTFSFCLGQMFGNLFYNTIFLFLYNTFMTIFSTIINQLIMGFLSVPLQGMAEIFTQGVATVTLPGVNPVTALAMMGTMYINFASDLWITLLAMAVGAAFFPPVFALLALALPLIVAWVGIMLSIGFLTAYYIPVLPYLIFTFGSIAWLMAVVEAMVAAPIVALGVTHPEGHDAFGKGEAAIMLLMNIFLRPAMMVIGFIAGIALSYVGVWVLNAGFDQAISFIQNGMTSAAGSDVSSNLSLNTSQGASTTSTGSGTGGYTGWAGIYAFFFSILVYTTTYVIIVQRSFTLIYMLPDKVLRWIGGTPDNTGQEAAQWGEEVKQKAEKGGEETGKAQGQMGKQLGGYGEKAIGKVSGGAKKLGKGKGTSSMEGGEASAAPPEG